MRANGRVIRRDRRIPTARRVYDFWWDGDDRLRKITYAGSLPTPPVWPNPDGNWVFEADYDGDGVRNRAKSQWHGEHKYSWSAFGIVHDTNASRTFTPGLAQRKGTNDLFIHPDHLGSTRWLSEPSGAFPHGIRYNAFGQKMWIPPGTTDWQPVDFLFAGESGYITEYSDEQNPGVALLYLQQRYYDPDIGRFLTPDPIGFAGGLNLYAYCGNDPVNRVDPTGLADWQTGSYVGDVKLALKAEAQALNPVNLAKGGVALVKRVQQVGPEEAGKDLYRGVVETYKEIWTGKDIETKAQSAAAWAVTLAPAGAELLHASRRPAIQPTPVTPVEASRGGVAPAVRSQSPPAARNRFNTRKGAYDAAKRAGGGNEPYKDLTGAHGPHFHAGDGRGGRLNHDHYYYPNRFARKPRPW